MKNIQNCLYGWLNNLSQDILNGRKKSIKDQLFDIKLCGSMENNGRKFGKSDNIGEEEKLQRYEAIIDARKYKKETLKTKRID